LIPNKPLTPIGSNKSNENPEAPIDPESEAQPIIQADGTLDLDMPMGEQEQPKPEEETGAPDEAE
jgi:hypothetical protein